MVVVVVCVCVCMCMCMSVSTCYEILTRSPRQKIRQRRHKTADNTSPLLQNSKYISLSLFEGVTLSKNKQTNKQKTSKRQVSLSLSPLPALSPHISVVLVAMVTSQTSSLHTHLSLYTHGCVSVSHSVNQSIRV